MAVVLKFFRERIDLPSETPVEEPRLLRRSIELIVDKKVRSKTDLLQSDICLGAADVEQLASLPTHYFAESLRWFDSNRS
jgi:hypothetical protein